MEIPTSIFIGFMLIFLGIGFMAGMLTERRVWYKQLKRGLLPKAKKVK
jgi:uncharacterized membrane protein